MFDAAIARHLSEARICDGRLHLLADPEAVAAGLHVALGDLALPLLPLGADASGAGRPFAAALPLRATPDAAEGPPGGPPGEQHGTASVTLLKEGDWALRGETTAMVTFRKTDAPLLVPVTEGLALPPARGRLALTGLVATHRCLGAAVVLVQPARGGEVRRIEIPLDPACLGGPDEAGWQRLDIALEDVAPGDTLRLCLRFDAWQQGARQEWLAIGFAARLRLREATTGAAQAAALHEPPPPSHPAILPRILPGERDPRHRWFEVELPADPAALGGQPVLRGAGIALPLPALPAARISVVHDDGHSLVLRADRPLEVLLCLNRTPVARLALGAGETPVRLPAAWLTGEPTALALRDTSNSATLFHTAILPPRILTPAETLPRESKPAYPPALFAASAFRYAALRAHAEHPRPGIPPETLARAVSILEGGHERLRPAPLHFPHVEAPEVSVVIPAHNHFAVTYSCLCALLLAWNEASFEVILVDDGSTDATARIGEVVRGITIIRNEAPQRFIRACNAGAAQARGRHIVLLNNDTEPTTGWLDALLDAMRRFPRAGAVGAKLLFPDGRLQDGGGIIWGNGNPWNYGYNQNPWEPRHCYARQVDYLSGAALMTTRAIWEEVGGLSAYLEPMYFEDTDFSFKIREAGYTTWFVPSAIVFHHEGKTSGTDTAQGFKRFQEVNRPKFRRRWVRAYAGHGPEGLAPDLEKDRGIIGRVLFVDYTTPRPDQDAGSYAAWQEIRLVQSLGYKVTFLPENLAHFGSYTTDFEKQGVEMVVAPFVLSLDEFIAARGAEFDAVYITRYHVAQNVVPKIRAANPRARIIMNNADLHFLRVMRAAHAEGDAARMAEAERVREAEIAAMRAVDLVLSYSDVEHAVIQSHTRHGVRVMTCPWVIEPPAAVPGRRGRSGLSFLGGFRHFPNAEGIRWMAREVMPALAALRPDITLSIYGSGMTEEVEALGGPNIRPMGFVEDVAAAYDPHMVFVAPLLSGAGIKGKVLGAMAAGIPCVLSPLAAEGIGLRHGHDCLICRTPREWVDAILRLHADPPLWKSIATHAREYVTEAYSFARGRERMREAFEAVELYGVPS